MFKLQDKRYVIDGSKLCKRRKRFDYTLARMAFLCGWSASYQWRLENGRVETISEASKNIIEDVLK